MNSEKFKQVRIMFETTDLGTCHFNDPLTKDEINFLTIYMDKYHKPWFFCCDYHGLQSKHSKYNKI